MASHMPDIFAKRCAERVRQFSISNTAESAMTAEAGRALSRSPRGIYAYVRQEYSRFHLDVKRLAAMGHSAGGQLALCLAAHESSLSQAISLAGVVDLKKAFSLHLSNDAVVEFLGGKPSEVPEHYREADPMEFEHCPLAAVVLHGADDDTVPPALGREYAEQKKKRGERVELVEIANAGHYDLIDPRSEAFKRVKAAVFSALG